MSRGRYAGAAKQFGQLSLAQYPSVAIGESHQPVNITAISDKGSAAAGTGVPCSDQRVAAMAKQGQQLTLACAKGQKIASISFARFGQLGMSGQMVKFSGPNGCYDKKYVPGCIFYVQGDIKYFFKAGEQCKCSLLLALSTCPLSIAVALCI